MRYRSRIDIISQILETANGGATKTKIMYKALLSYNQMRDYLVLLVEKGLLEYTPEQKQQELPQIFRTTEKGLRFLDKYNRLGDLINALPSPLAEA